MAKQLVYVARLVDSDNTILAQAFQDKPFEGPLRAEQFAVELNVHAEILGEGEDHD